MTILTPRNPSNESAGNGMLYRLLVILGIGSILALSITILGFVLTAKATLKEVADQQVRMQGGIALIAVIGTLAPEKQERLFDLALQQVSPLLQPEIRRRVLIPGVPEVSPRNYAP